MNFIPFMGLRNIVERAWKCDYENMSYVIVYSKIDNAYMATAMDMEALAFAGNARAVNIVDEDCNRLFKTYEAAELAVISYHRAHRGSQAQ